MSWPVREPAHAKLNLFLRVRGRRDDSYHEIETLIQPLTLADGIEVSAARGLSLLVVGSGAGQVPHGEDNLVLRAARELAGEAGIEPNARVLLAKNIPVAAGVGGGSADAAATLRALNELWELGLPISRLLEVGARVGSDVPALVHAAPVLARGRGEVVEPREVTKTWWVLLPGDLQIAAADAYAWWDEEPTTGPEPEPLLAALATGAPEEFAPLLFNDLERAVKARHPEVGRLTQRLVGLGALAAIMCGSGPTVAGLARGPRHAEELAAETGGLVAASVHEHPGGP